MTLEDHAGDIVGKARKGLGVAPEQVTEVGGFTGPLVLGAIADSSWGFAGAFGLVVVVCGLLVVPTARLRRQAGAAG